MKNGIIFSILTAALFITLEPVSKLIANDVNPYTITFLRFFISAVVMLPFAAVKVKKEKIKITPKDIGTCLFLGIIFICISMVFLQIGVKKADSPALISIIFSSNSMFTVIFTALILKENLTKQKIIAILLCAIGVIICADFSSGSNMESVLYGLCAAVVFSAYTVLTKKFMTKLGGTVQAAISFLLGSVVLFVVLLFTGIPTFTVIMNTNIVHLLYLGIAVTGIGYLSYFKAMEKGGTIMASLAFFIKPVLTPFATFFINGIDPEPKIFLAILFVVAGSYLAVTTKKYIFDKKAVK